jgi:hypothetical protein
MPTEDCSPGVSKQSSEINVWNQKVTGDRFAALMAQGAEDNQANSRGWQAFNLANAQDAQTMKHLATLGVISAGQTGVTENQQSVTPVRQATGDAIVGGVGVSAEQVAANISNLATSITAVIASSLATAIAQTLAAVLPVVVTAAGGASTPSQTSSKPVGS